MQHFIFEGPHYQIGLQYGALLAQRGNFILEHLPYPLTGERYAFADACRPIYRRCFPQILAEIQGIADGQHCSAAALEALLFSMYALPPACGCSCFAAACGGQVLLGRNSDFWAALEPLNANVIYDLPGPAHSFTGNTTAFAELEDGINEEGLALGLTAVCPAFGAVRPGLNAGLLLRFLLERCGTTQQVLQQVRALPIASALTLTVADRWGEIAVIEANAEALAVLRPAAGQPVVYAVNTFHTEEMARFRADGIDDWDSARRYQTLRSFFARTPSPTPGQAMALLAGREGFLCQYDRTAGKDTVWSVLYQPAAAKIFRAEGNPGRTPFRADRRFPFCVE